MVKNKKLKPIAYILIFVCLFISTIIGIILHKITEDKGGVNYEKMLSENKLVLEKISKELMSLDSNNLTIRMDLNELLVYDNGNPINITDVLSDKEICDDIKDIYKSIHIQHIDKLDGYIKFEFRDKYGPISIIYTDDKSKLSGYADLEDLGGNWYFWGVIMPNDKMY